MKIAPVDGRNVYVTQYILETVSIGEWSVLVGGYISYDIKLHLVTVPGILEGQRYHLSSHSVSMHGAPEIYAIIGNRMQ